MSYLIDTTGETYFFCNEHILSGGHNNVINVSGSTTVVGLADSGAGAIVEASFVCDDGAKIYDFGNAYCDPSNKDSLVNLDHIVAGDFQGPGQTILEAAGGVRDLSGNIVDNGQIPEHGFTYYLSGGAGNDTIIGSKCNDFIRGNAGDDILKAGKGDDLVRPGSGNDTINLGQGLDNLYITSDALIREKGVIETKLVNDFKSSDDKVSFQGSKENYTISGIGTKVLEVFYKPADTVTRIVSGDNGTAFSQEDITFVG